MARARGSHKSLGPVLVNEGVLTQTQVDEAAKYQRGSEDPLGPHLIRCEFITAWDLAKAVANHFSMPFFDLASFTPKSEHLELIDAAFLHGYTILPIDKFGKVLTLAVVENLSPEVLQSIVDKTELAPYLYVAPYDVIRMKLEEHVPYDAPEGEGGGLFGGGGGDEAGADDDDWMAIFEEAEKNLGGDEDVEQVEESDGEGADESEEAKTG